MTPDTTIHPIDGTVADKRAFELIGLYDDPEDPSEYTVYPADADGELLQSRWISADVSTTVSLDEMR